MGMEVLTWAFTDSWASSNPIPIQLEPISVVRRSNVYDRVLICETPSVTTVQGLQIFVSIFIATYYEL